MAKEKAIESNEKDENTAVEKAVENSETWKYTLKKPLEYMDETYNELEFDFGKLTGEDIESIESELETLRLPLHSSLGISDNYISKVAAYACVNLVDAPAFEELGVKDFREISRRTRRVLDSAKVKVTEYGGEFEIALKKPLDTSGGAAENLVFDFSKITSGEFLQAESECLKSGHATFVMNIPSNAYAARIAVKACKSNLKADDLKKLSAVDYVEILVQTRVFIGIAV